MNALNLIEVIVGIGALIFVHELGHFLAAKWCGVRCEKFYLGFDFFGLKLFRKQIGDTEYGVGLFPLGGYVKMTGQDDVDPGAVGNVSDPGNFNSKSIAQRALILSGGVIMNVLFAVAVFLAAFLIGARFQRPVAGTVLSGSPAWEAGLQDGDEIIAVKGKETDSFAMFLTEVAFADRDEGLEVTVRRRDDAGGTGEHTLRLHPRPDEDRGMQTVGVFQAMGLTVNGIEQGGPADRTGAIRARDRITAVRPEGAEDWIVLDDTPDTVGDLAVDAWPRLQQAIAGAPGVPVRLRIQRHGEQVEETIRPVPRHTWQVGVMLSQVPRVHAVRGGAAAGLRRGMVVRSVDDRPIATVSDLQDALPEDPAAEVTLTAARGDAEAETVTVTAGALRDDVHWRGDTVVVEVVPDSPAAAAGVRAGDRITAVAEVEIREYGEISRILNGGPSVAGLPAFYSRISAAEDGSWQVDTAEAPTAVAFTVRRDGATEILQIRPNLKPELDAEGNQVGAVGISPGPQYHLVTADGPIEALGKGLTMTWVWVEQVFLTIKAILSQQVAARHLGGPVMIAQAAYAFSALGFGTLLYFLGMISVNLAVLNVLPIPVLDGGHLLFLAIEKLRGRPVSPMVVVVSTYVGVALMLALMIFVTWNDIARILG